MYTTLGAPAGAFGGSNGAQSGTESLISTLIVPLNCSLTSSLLRAWTHGSAASCRLCPSDSGRRRGASPSRGENPEVERGSGAPHAVRRLGTQLRRTTALIVR